MAVLGISRCQSLRNPMRFATRHHSVLTDALGLELRRPPSRIRPSAPSFSRWMLEPCAEQSVTGQLSRSYVERRMSTSCVLTAKRCSVRSTPQPAAAERSSPRGLCIQLGVAISQACYATGENQERAVRRKLQGRSERAGKRRCTTSRRCWQWR